MTFFFFFHFSLQCWWNIHLETLSENTLNSEWQFYFKSGIWNIGGPFLQLCPLCHRKSNIETIPFPLAFQFSRAIIGPNSPVTQRHGRGSFSGTLQWQVHAALTQEIWGKMLEISSSPFFFFRLGKYARNRHCITEISATLEWLDRLVWWLCSCMYKTYKCMSVVR